MKHLLLVAIMAIASFTTKAQWVANASSCDIEYRQICIDLTTCTVSYPSTTWVSSPANSHLPLTILRCNPGEVVGYEVRYDAGSTGCTNTPVTVIDHNFGPSACGINAHEDMGTCACNVNPLGAHVHFNGTNLHIDN